MLQLKTPLLVILAVRSYDPPPDPSPDCVVCRVNAIYQFYMWIDVCEYEWLINVSWELALLYSLRSSLVCLMLIRMWHAERKNTEPIHFSIVLKLGFDGQQQRVDTPHAPPTFSGCVMLWHNHGWLHNHECTNAEDCAIVVMHAKDSGWTRDNGGPFYKGGPLSNGGYLGYLGVVGYQFHYPLIHIMHYTPMLLVMGYWLVTMVMASNTCTALKSSWSP